MSIFTQYFRYQYQLALIFILIILLLPWTFFGVSFADQGFSSYLAFTKHIYPETAYWEITSFGSSWYAGVWMNIVGNDFMLLFRFGWVLLNIACLLLAMNIVNKFYTLSKIEYILSGVATVAVATSTGVELVIPEYHNIPPLFLLATIIFLLKSDINSVGKIITAGIFAGMAVWARLPLLPLIFIGLGGYYCYIGWVSNNIKRNLRYYLTFILGLLLGIGVIWGMLFLQGNNVIELLQDTFYSFKTTDAQFGGVENIKSTLLRYFKLLTVGSLLWGCIYITLHYVPNKIRQFFAIGISMMMIVGAYLLPQPDFRLFGFHYGIIVTILMGVPFVQLIYIFYLLYKRKIELDKQQLYILSIAFFIITSLGSNMPYMSMLKYGVWLLIPVSLTTLKDIVWMSDKARQWYYYTYIAVAVTFFLSTRFFLVYADVTAAQASAVFSVKPLQGTRSSHNTVKVVEEALKQLHEVGVQPGDTILAFPELPAMYYFTKTVSWFKNPWVGQVLLTYKDYKKEFEEKKQSIGVPKIVIRSKVSPYAVDWGKQLPEFFLYEFGVGEDRKKLFVPYNYDKVKYIDTFLLENKYKVHWENEVFVILKSN